MLGSRQERFKVTRESERDRARGESHPIHIVQLSCVTEQLCWLQLTLLFFSWSGAGKCLVQFLHWYRERVLLMPPWHLLLRIAVRTSVNLCHQESKTVDDEKWQLQDILLTTLRPCIDARREVNVGSFSGEQWWNVTRRTEKQIAPTMLDAMPEESSALWSLSGWESTRHPENRSAHSWTIRKILYMCGNRTWAWPSATTLQKSASRGTRDVTEACRSCE